MLDIIEVFRNFKSLSLACIIGVAAMLISTYFSQLSILDPLFLALIIGIILGSFVKFGEDIKRGLRITAMFLIPLGVIFYGAVNLNFKKFFAIDPMFIFVVLFIFLSYSTFVFLFSTLFNLDSKSSYLVTAGSVVCGASAITITSDAIDAEPDQVSRSLVSIFLSAILGLFFIFPIVAYFLKLSVMDYSVMSGALFQFTGFVKAAIADNPIAKIGSANPAMDLGVSIKAVRYLGLLILIPLFSSFVKGKFHVPWYLWAFLLAGIVFSYVSKLAGLINILKPIQLYLWSIAMGAIGLGANFKVLFSKEGVKTFLVSFISFLCATGVFLALYIPFKELKF